MILVAYLVFYSTSASCVCVFLFSCRSCHSSRMSCRVGSSLIEGMVRRSLVQESIDCLITCVCRFVFIQCTYCIYCYTVLDLYTFIIIHFSFLGALDGYPDALNHGDCKIHLGLACNPMAPDTPRLFSWILCCYSVQARKL